MRTEKRFSVRLQRNSLIMALAMKVISQVEAQRKILEKQFPLRWSWPQANRTVRKLRQQDHRH